ncbi:MAG: hypothetical protein ACLQVL_33170 [Terriglobia bacterium]
MPGHHPQSKMPTASPVTKGGSVPASEENEVRALLARGSTKHAVELAKQIHKHLSSPASESLLVDAYSARIRSLLKVGLATEAKALLDLVRERYPSAKEKFGDIGVVVASKQDTLDELLAPLNDPALPQERRLAIEAAIKCQVSDLSALVQCPTLAMDHPLRMGAAALMRVLEAVTSGAVPDDALLLPEVSRRGPLAPWKFLVRAISCFYRNDDTGSAECLQAIDPDSAPARLIPALRAALEQGPVDRLPPASASLVAQIEGKQEALRKVLKSLDDALAKSAEHKIIPEIQRAISLCTATCPELVERLRLHVWTFAIRSDLNMRRLDAALGGPVLKNAYFWRLYAREVEFSDNPLKPAACRLWEEFRRHAVAENWFREDGPEAAALYVHMAELMQEVPPEALGDVQRDFAAKAGNFPRYYDDQPAAIRAVAAKYDSSDVYFLFPEKLFERACTLDPHAEAFQKWLDWAMQEGDWKAAERVCTIWNRALPNDSRPLLHLMESAESRGALDKAFGFLKLAQKCDALGTEVRRAAFRLLVAKALRHLRQRKPHLAEQDVTALEALPQAQEADRPAFVACLRWTCSVLDGNSDGAAGLLSQVSRLLDSPAAGALACESTANACGLAVDRFLPEKAVARQTDSLACAIARACALGDDVGVAFNIPPAWESRILQELSKKPDKLEVRQLLALGEAALRRNRRELAYAASTAGLDKGGDAEGRFVLMRARALPGGDVRRRTDCLAAAAELGRRYRDVDLVDQAVDLQRGGSGRPNFLDWAYSMEEPAASLSTERLNQVLKREKRARKFPVSSWAPESEYEPFDDDLDEEDDDDLDQVDLEEFSRLLDEMGRAQPRKKPPKRPRPTWPGQGELF